MAVRPKQVTIKAHTFKSHVAPHQQRFRSPINNNALARLLQKSSEEFPFCYLVAKLPDVYCGFPAAHYCVTEVKIFQSVASNPNALPEDHKTRIIAVVHRYAHGKPFGNRVVFADLSTTEWHDVMNFWEFTEFILQD